ncbi:hypothetical protein CSKR_105329, partial [Clonorchis sinensis]
IFWSRVVRLAMKDSQPSLMSAGCFTELKQWNCTLDFRRRYWTDVSAHSGSVNPSRWRVDEWIHSSLGCASDFGQTVLQVVSMISFIFFGSSSKSPLRRSDP